ncbi:proline-rich protein HaeIII subfamily 1-like [Equus quagga]|uniref:proline-rich protein HaeIII subfamily 1-like n=1 Tax=Equus quagga TaxID=89248 RepID=UPI001EE1C22A|nr:proline-rich protein HaeIII subfamily 1-like [Equus quagga]XP_046508171.1 proline-rich protein HaeIII subfamily 1-like [Equus quagga]
MARGAEALAGGCATACAAAPFVTDSTGRRCRPRGLKGQQRHRPRYRLGKGCPHPTPTPIPSPIPSPPRRALRAPVPARARSWRAPPPGRPLLAGTQPLPPSSSARLLALADPRLRASRCPGPWSPGRARGLRAPLLPAWGQTRAQHIAPATSARRRVSSCQI